MPPSRRSNISVYYTQHGEGTTDDPATISFNFKQYGGRPEDMKRNTPDTVEIEFAPDGSGYVMRGKDTTMTRAQLLVAFRQFVANSGWTIGSRL